MRVETEGEEEMSAHRQEIEKIIADYLDKDFGINHGCEEIAREVFVRLDEKGFDIVPRATGRAQLGIEERLDRIWRAEAALLGSEEPEPDMWISVDVGRFKKTWEVRGHRDDEGDPRRRSLGETLEEAVSKYETALKAAVSESTQIYEELSDRPKRALVILDTGFLHERKGL